MSVRTPRDERRSALSWVYPNGEKWTPPPAHPWDVMLMTGNYKVVEADTPFGPYTDARVLDNGDICVTKRYLRIVRK